jgi:protein-S-isoprenylcysteine O-methyltransferase Ste14
MRRAFAILGTAIFLVLAPGTVAGWIPWWITRWRVQSPAIARLPLRVSGAVLVAGGVAVLLDSFARFALKGSGTPVPVFPTQHLVVSGLYRYVRNPMYVAVLAVILGQALIFGSIRLLEYAAVAWLAAQVFVVAYEEPTLRASFGAEYEAFRAAVPRWIPRLTPWHGNSHAG